jgi:hypothetical protein
MIYVRINDLLGQINYYSGFGYGESAVTKNSRVAGSITETSNFSV